MLTSLQQANQLTRILEDAEAILKSDDKLSSMIPFHVRKKGQNEDRRYDSLLSYKGPDEATVEFLARSSSTWLQNPSHFWNGGRKPNLAGLEPQAQIVGCFLHAQDEDV